MMKIVASLSKLPFGTASEILNQLEADGFIIVPKVPSDAMIAAMKPLTDGPPTHRWQWVWNTLIAAVNQ